MRPIAIKLCSSAVISAMATRRPSKGTSGHAQSGFGRSLLSSQSRWDKPRLCRVFCACDAIFIRPYIIQACTVPGRSGPVQKNIWSTETIYVIHRNEKAQIRFAFRIAVSGASIRGNKKSALFRNTLPLTSCEYGMS